MTDNSRQVLWVIVRGSFQNGLHSAYGVYTDMTQACDVAHRACKAGIACEVMTIEDSSSLLDSIDLRESAAEHDRSQNT